MAMSKSTGETKDKAAPKKKVAPKATAAKKAAPKTKPAAKATVKTAAHKKAVEGGRAQAVPAPDHHARGDLQGGRAHYLAEKKPDQKMVDALLKHKLVKKGKKDEKTKNFYVMISLAGKKFLGTKPAAVAKA